jgi:hypothetical protein
MTTMKLILTAEVTGLGTSGDTVEVKGGYGRNYLLPRGLAIQATRGAEKQVESLRRARATREVRSHDEAEALADRLAVITAGRIVAEGTPATLGGRQAMPATVGWSEDGAQRHETTATPAASVAGLISRFGGEVPGLTVRRPSLEDVYLELIADADPTGRTVELVAAGGPR